MEELKQIVIRGTVTDTKTGEPIPGANVYLKSDRTNSAFSNEQGFFLLETAPETPADVLVITAAGYQRYTEPVDLDKNITLQTALFKRTKTDDDRSVSDITLVKQALAGSQRAYTQLMDRYRDSIYFIIQKMVKNRDDADDLTMEAFGKAFNSLAKYSSDYAFSTWLYRIAINNCIDFVRKKRLETFSLDTPIIASDDDEGQQPVKDFESDMPNPEASFIQQQRIMRVRNVIDRLQPKYRKLIEMRFLNELSYEEIAEATKMPLGTVKAQLFRARELLFNILNNQDDRF